VRSLQFPKTNGSPEIVLVSGERYPRRGFSLPPSSRVVIDGRSFFAPSRLASEPRGEKKEDSRRRNLIGEREELVTFTVYRAYHRIHRPIRPAALPTLITVRSSLSRAREDRPEARALADERELRITETCRARALLMTSSTLEGGSRARRGAESNRQSRN